jgi:hypothetical protein
MPVRALTASAEFSLVICQSPTAHVRWLQACRHQPAQEAPTQQNPRLAPNPVNGWVSHNSSNGLDQHALGAHNYS